MKTLSGPWWNATFRAAAGERATVAEIFIYADIGESWWEETVSARDFVKALQEIDAEQINLRINSEGGSVPDGMAIYNALRRHSARVVVTVDGVAASVASLIAMAGDEIEMADAALLMIHAPWTGIAGNAEQLRDMAKTLDQFAEAMATAYARMIPIEQARALMADGKDHWYTAEEALAAGLIHRAVDHKTAARAALRRFRPPAEMMARLGIQPLAAAAAHFHVQGSPMPEAQPLAAPSTASPPSPPPAAAGPSSAEIRAQVLAEERVRQAALREIAAPFVSGRAQHPAAQALLDQALADMTTTAETFRADLLQAIAQGASPVSGNYIATLADERDKFKAGATIALLGKAGLAPIERGNEFVALSLFDLARESLARAHVSARGMSRMQIVANAFTHSTSDFPSLLGDVATKSMLKGYEEQQESFPLWTSKGTLPDFKAARRVDLNTFPALPEVKSAGEIQYQTVGERGESIQLATYAGLFSVSRQTVINDDLGAFTTIPRRQGSAAKRTIGNLVYAVLTSNPTMSDGVALFHASHANLLTGAAITTASVDAMAAAIAKQVDATGTVLNLEMAYLVVPRALLGLASQVANDEKEVISGKTGTNMNYLRGRFQVVSDARLDAASASNWFGVVNPAIADTIEVAYLDGNETPYLEQQTGFEVDGTIFKVRLDVGVKALDWRGMAKNPN